MQNSEPQIIHEAEIQRQHVRIPVPGHAFIGGKSYPLQDISAGGFCATEVKEDFENNQKIIVELSIPLNGFSLRTTIPCLAEHYDSKTKIIGCRYIELTEDQISLITTIIQSKMNGHILDQNDILHVAGRQNFVANDHKPDEMAPNAIKKYLTLAFLLSFGVVGLYLIFGNIYDNVSILKSYQGVVQTETITARATIDGEFTSLITADTQQVAKGQPIATITGFSLSETEINTPIIEQTNQEIPSSENNSNSDDGSSSSFTPLTLTVVSPCDCHVVHQFVQDGEFRALGESLFKLVPLDAEPWISTTIQANEGQRLNLQDDARIKIAGESSFVDGHVSNFNVTDEEIPTIKVRVKPSTPLPLNLIGRPTYVEFMVF